MIPLGLLSRQTHGVYVALFASLALATLQNVTVDDAVLTGAVVPQYLPSPSDWNTGNNCTACFVKPDPSLAYNGTWHDATYSPTNNYSQAIEFTFTGSALYIFFIIANYVTNASTFTNVEFVLDNGVATTSYIHSPGATTDYSYNVSVYTNESLPSGQHNMMIEPINSGNNVLILFDYLIYTTDTSSSSSATSTSPPSQTSSGAQETSSGQNIGAIVGGVVGGATALVLVIASLLCYRRHIKRRNGGRPLTAGGAAVEPFFSSPEIVSTPLLGVTSASHPIGPPFPKPVSATGSSTVTLQQSIPPVPTVVASSSDVLSSTNSGLVEQVEQLRTEVARLRNLHEAPPEYSLGLTDQ